MEQVFEVGGMSCGHCVKAVTTAVQEIDAQARVDVALDTGRVTVESSQPRDAIAKAIEAAGYPTSA